MQYPSNEKFSSASLLNGQYQQLSVSEVPLKRFHELTKKEDEDRQLFRKVFPKSRNEKRLDTLTHTLPQHTNSHHLLPIGGHVPRNQILATQVKAQ